MTTFQEDPVVKSRSRLAAALGRFGLAFLVAAFVGGGLASEASASKKVALFLFELEDSSLEGEVGGIRKDETERLKLVTDEARKLLAALPDLQVLDLAPVAKAAEEKAPFYKCNGCEVDVARMLGADLAITGWVQKVSNLILNLNFSVRDVKTGERVRLMSVDIRTNSDEMWLRGVRYLVKNRLTDPPL